MKRKAIEDTIRDNLSENLSIISSELTLLKKEYFLPNAIGTRGFIDILAKDTKNHYVIIEIKRSNEASREAIHEILKYVEALKENKKVNESEIKAIIVSTEWKELIVPFSSFVGRVNFSVEGFLLKIDDNIVPLYAEKITPFKLRDERFFSPVHSLYLYETQDRLQEGIESHIHVFKEKGIDDYVLVIMTAPDDLKEKASAQLDRICEEIEISIDHELIPDYPYLIYSAFIRLSESEYLDLIGINQELYEEMIAFISSNGAKGEKKLEIYESYLTGMLEPYPYADLVEISYPAKFYKKLLEDEGWIIEKVLRFGSLKDNELLEDSVIISEISGEPGTRGGNFKCNFNSKDIAKLEEAKKGIKRVLGENKVWLNHINCILQYYNECNNEDNFIITILIYSPHNILLSLYRQLQEENDYFWLPSYELLFESHSLSKNKLYVGSIKWDGTKADIHKILSKYYKNSTWLLAIPMLWGGYEENNIKIMKELGLSFGTLLHELNLDNISSVYEFENFEFVPTDIERKPYRGINEFIINNREFIECLIKSIDEHYSSSYLIST